ncbi:MAG: hypothetical protein AB4368_24180 [Xenococcaceae cyanobacterium]
MSTSINTQAYQQHLNLDAEARTYISRQARMFESMLPELLTKYSGQWVWFENHQVLDADLSYQALLTRVKKSVGEQIVLIKKVESHS